MSLTHRMNLYDGEESWWTVTPPYKSDVLVKAKTAFEAWQKAKLSEAFIACKCVRLDEQ